MSSNSERVASIRVREVHWHIVKLAFDRMNLKFGMEGFGEFANLMPGFADQLPIERTDFRYFENSSIAYAFLGMERGYHVTTRIEEGGTRDYEGNERKKVFVDLTPHDDRKPISFQISGGAPDDAARSVCDYLEDASRRITPME